MVEEDYFVEKNLKKDSEENHISPSRKYSLSTLGYKTKDGFGDYSRGLIYKTGNKDILFDVKRNHSSFEFCFVEGHSNGHDYLICGEDYQGQTILELDTGKRADYLPDGAKDGVGFCWVQVNPSVEKNVLAVLGCFWACPTEVRFVDFSNPMKPPFLVFSEYAVEDESVFKKGWSEEKGIELITTDRDGENKKNILWKKPTSIEVLQYWKSEAEKVDAQSKFLPDLKTQEALAKNGLENNQSFSK